MGKETLSRTTYKSAVKRYVTTRGSVTVKAEQQARKTGKLHQLVDPAGYGAIRRSLPRFEQEDNSLWGLTVGTPIPIETRVDTTGSMGDNVDVALRVLPDAYELWSMMLPGYDLQIATGIFGDIQDNFVLCRPQFEMTAEKIVEQLTLMVPERDGGDRDEDPHYGLFGSAYLTSAYINKISLKGYDFTVSDAPARDWLDERQLRRIYSEEVFEKVIENGHQMNTQSLPTTKEIVQDLLKRAHAFFLQVESAQDTTKFWAKIFGPERVVVLPSTELLPQVQAAIIGLTEGTIDLQQVEEFLQQNNVNTSDARSITRSVANIPIRAQANLPNFNKRPQKGDLFNEKTDLWPIGSEETISSDDVPEEKPKPTKPNGITWL
ncbi:hypothetical protein CL633_04055 [bacterium]|nr:hypothetical protein [bacterium]|tara:strand:- start:11781 stop:12911 length:1131 start_codon:yes stop_codon:yes gene_type:complete